MTTVMKEELTQTTFLLEVDEEEYNVNSTFIFS
jgi:hypothetical protein